MTKQMAGMGMKGKLGAAKDMARAGGMPGLPGMSTKGSTRTRSVKSGFKQRKKRR